MRNILIDERITKVLIEFLQENGKEIRESPVPCWCSMGICGDDDDVYIFDLKVRYKDYKDEEYSAE